MRPLAFRRFPLRRAAALALGLAAGCAAPGAPSAASIEQVIEAVKTRVNPTIVFVKPIQEEFEQGKRTQQEVFGSGVVISPDGYVVTNNHVAERALMVRCVLWNRKQVTARVVGTDKDTDIAVLKLDLDEEDRKAGLPSAEFGDSDRLTEGQFVMAFGSPFGFSRTVTQGIVSNTRRYIGFETEHKYNLWIQTDAAINPGNSGGPLIDTGGRIVGINTLGLGGGSGLAFAIPSNVVREIAGRIRTAKDGKVRRAFFGIQIQPLRDFSRNTFFEGTEGVLVSGVEPQSPAEEAGIQRRDLLLAVNGRRTDGLYAEDLPGIEWGLADLPIDEKAVFHVRRDGKGLDLEVVPRLKGKVEGENFDCERWNLTVKEISRFENPNHHFFRKKGLFINGVKRPGNGSEAGLQAEDILVRVDRREVNTLEEMKKAYEEILADGRREKEVLVEALRQGYPEFFVLDYRKDYKRMEEE